MTDQSSWSFSWQSCAELSCKLKCGMVGVEIRLDVYKRQGQPRSLRHVVAVIPWLVVAWRGSTSISPLTLSSSKTGVKPEDLEGVEVSTALLFTGSLRRNPQFTTSKVNLEVSDT